MTIIRSKHSAQCVQAIHNTSLVVGRFTGILFCLMSFAGASSVTGQTLSCATYLASYNDNNKISFAYGYLEGVEAALTKDIVDVLVPPSHINHPLRWVTPEGINSYKSFAERLSSACTTQPSTDLVQAALSIAQRHEGRPEVGAWIDKETGKLSTKDQEKWKRFMGDAIPCKVYIESPVATRDAIVSGYFVGTEAYRISMKQPADDLFPAWPLGVETKAIRSLLDKGCRDPREANGDIRAGLWMVTFELWKKAKK